MQSKQFTDRNGNIVKVGDRVKFKVLIGWRAHISTSRVYDITPDYLLISCNGIRKGFRLRFSEVITKIS